ncbi:hypothetical protein C8R45DRAFT_1044602 [Mycena sanguinolenta]|nr:hypothetical protein C8R45DRAFT_1044602 [Mycena sanguinolenta]
MLSELSVELLQEIADHLNNSDYANFRAVSKDTSFAMEPLFFARNALSRQHLRLKSGHLFLKTLATGETGWSRYARLLKISRGNRIEIGEELAGFSDTALQQLLASALRSMMNIQTFIWEVHQGVPTSQSTVICDYLYALPSLEDLQLIVEDVELPLDRFSGLRSFQITTPYWKECRMVQQVSQLVARCSNLTILHVFGFTDWSQLWLTLHRANADRVKEIYTNVVTDHLLGYLASYSGIEKLSLYRPDIESVAKSDRLANTFFDVVVPQHAHTLVNLACSTPYESRWSFGAHNVDLLSNSLRLETLEVSVNEDDVVNIAPPMNAVDLILRAVEHIPALRRLQISPGVAQTHRNTRHANPGIRHVNAVYLAITATVKEFRSYNPSVAIICVNGHSYILKPVITGSAAQENMLFGYFAVT